MFFFVETLSGHRIDVLYINHQYLLMDLANVTGLKICSFSIIAYI